MLDNACRQQGAGRNLDRFRIPLVLDRVFREQSGEDLRVRQRSDLGSHLRVRILWHPIGLLDLQLELVCCRLQAIRLLIDHVVEALGRFGKLARRRLLLQFAFNFGLDLLERPNLGRLDPGQFDDVIAELGLDQPGQIAFLLLENLILERFDHHAASKETKVAALLRRAGIFRMLLGEIGEFLRRLLQFRQHLLGLGFCLFLVRVRLRQDQDMARATLFRHFVAILVTVVPGLNLSIADRYLTQQRIERQDHVFGFDLFGDFVLGLVVVVVLLNFASLNLHLVRKRLRRNPEFVELPLFKLKPEQVIRLRRRNERGFAYPAEQLLERQILAQPRFELRLRHPFRTQRRFVALH